MMKFCHTPLFLLLFMTTRSQFILLNDEICNKLHPGTVAFFRWMQETKQYELDERYQIAGLYFRQRVVNVDEMEGTAQFFTKYVDGLRSVKNALHVANLQHSSAIKTLDYAYSIDLRVREFIEESGGMDMLPFHPNQRITFRVQPKGLWSNTATAMFYQNFRCGYFHGFSGAQIVRQYGKERVEHGYGIIEVARTPGLGYMTLLVPKSGELIYGTKPRHYWYENEPHGSKIHKAPDPEMTYELLEQ